MLADNKDPNNENLSEELQTILRSLVDGCEREDSYIRKQQLKAWKKHEEFWHGIQYIFWSETRQDWIAPGSGSYQDEGGREGAEGPFYDYVINIYRAHGESVIAALSAQVPTVRFPPDDADSDDDLSTSKTYSRIADLIQRHNPAKLIIMQSLYTLWNQGLVAMYHAPKADKSFGFAEIPEYGMGVSCDSCETSRPVTDGEDPEVSPIQCPDCGGNMVSRPVVIQHTQVPKSRIITEVHGPIEVKVSYYSKAQQDFGYLLYSRDLPIDFLRSIYSHVKDKLDASTKDLGTFERIARAPSTFSSSGVIDDNRNLRTLKLCWLRPWKFDGLPEEQVRERDELKKMFPEGCCVAFVGDTYVESRAENLDTYWTVGKGGLSTYIHSDPLGQPLVPVQELRNVLINLTQETIEHSIPSEYADPKVLDFDTYSRHEARPGMVYPATPLPGKGLNESFHESGRATLSKEVQAFGDQIDKDSQFVVGSFPSIYGGPGEGNSRTASEYTQSRQMALQRLSIAWTYLNFWWARVMEKCVKLYVESMIEDERFVQKNGTNWVNIWIKRSELTGKVGDVEPEGADTFPVSSAQKQTLLLKLLELQNDFLNTAIFDPDNRQLVGDAMGFPEFKIPGEDQRVKQAWEVKEMLKGGQLVPIEPEVDDHEIHISYLKGFLVGDSGLILKQTQPDVYELLKQHLIMHLQAAPPEPQPEEEEVQSGASR